MLFIPFLICLIIYIIVGFYGLKLKNIVFSFLFFFLGYTVSNILFEAIIANPILLFVINFGIGLILGSFSVKLYNFSSFMICFLLVFLICLDIFNTSILQYGLGIILGLIVGYLGIKFAKVIIIFMTGIYGSINLVNLIFVYFTIKSALLQIIITIIITLFAINYQYKNNKEIE